MKLLFLKYICAHFKIKKRNRGFLLCKLKISNGFFICLNNFLKLFLLSQTLFFFNFCLIFDKNLFLFSNIFRLKHLSLKSLFKKKKSTLHKLSGFFSFEHSPFKIFFSCKQSLHTPTTVQISYVLVFMRQEKYKIYSRMQIIKINLKSKQRGVYMQGFIFHTTFSSFSLFQHFPHLYSPLEKSLLSLSLFLFFYSFLVYYIILH